MPSFGSVSPQGEAGEPRQWVDLESSSIASVSFVESSSELYVKYTSGDVWKYEDITPEMYKNLIHTGSSGAYLRAKIVPHHAGTKISSGSKGNTNS